MRRRLSWAIWFVIGLVAVAMGEPAGKGKPVAESAAKKTAKPRLAVTISKETTYITAPLRSDGTVDYVAALNQRSSEGATPENNAVVLLLQAAGPAVIDSKSRERFFKMLGIAPLPEKGPYLESYAAYFDRKSPGATAPKEGQGPNLSKEHWDEFFRLGERPWSKTEFPLAAAGSGSPKRRKPLSRTSTGRARPSRRLHESWASAGQRSTRPSADQAGLLDRGVCGRAWKSPVVGRLCAGALDAFFASDLAGQPPAVVPDC